MANREQSDGETCIPNPHLVLAISSFTLPYELLNVSFSAWLTGGIISSIVTCTLRNGIKASLFEADVMSAHWMIDGSDRWNARLLQLAMCSGSCSWLPANSKFGPEIKADPE